MFFLEKYKTRKGKRKYPWLYSREDLLDDDISFSDIFTDEQKQDVETLIGKWINDEYFILNFISRGTFSLVYLAYSFSKQEFVAIKMMLPCYKLEAKEEQKQHNILFNHIPNYKFQSFKWKSHPNIICFELELLGISLQELIKRKAYETLSSDQIITTFYKCLQDLNNIHDSKLIHTDLKLDNILTNIENNGRKEIKKWFISLNCNEWINLNVNKIMYKNRHKLFKTSYKKGLHLAKRNFARFFINNYDTFCRQKQDRTIQILENVMEVEDFDTLHIEDLEDVNPDNEIEYCDMFTTTIIDFGNALLEEDIEYDDITFENYRPPENIMYNQINKKSDIWTLGCIFYEILTNKYLFSTENKQNKDEEEDNLFLFELENTTDIILENIQNICSSDENTRQSNLYALILENQSYKINEHILEKIITLLSHMLDIESDKRWNASECLNHPLFEPFTYDSITDGMLQKEIYKDNCSIYI